MRAKAIIDAIHNGEPVSEMGTNTYIIFTIFVREDVCGSIRIEMAKWKPRGKLHSYRYDDFGELSKLLRTFETYYNEGYGIKNGAALESPTSKNSYSKSELTIHRGSNGNAQKTTG